MLKRELKINLKSMIIWCAIVVLMLVMVFFLYPYMFEGNTKNLIDQMMEMFPKELLKAFNMDLYSMSTVFGWIKTEGYMFITLFGGIYSSILGSSILSVEEKDKTIEFLASKPVTRNQIIKNKVICGLIYIFAFNLLIFIVNLVGLAISDDLIIKEVLLISFAPLMLYYVLFFISLLITVIIKNPKKTLYVGLIVTFVPYLLQLIGSISDKVSILKDISFFEFISIRYLLVEGHINYIYLIVTVFIIGASLLLTHKIYNNKELL